MAEIFSLLCLREILPDYVEVQSLLTEVVISTRQFIILGSDSSSYWGPTVHHTGVLQLYQFGLRRNMK